MCSFVCVACSCSSLEAVIYKWGTGERVAACRDDVEGQDLFFMPGTQNRNTRVLTVVEYMSHNPEATYLTTAEMH